MVYCPKVCTPNKTPTAELGKCYVLHGSAEYWVSACRIMIIVSVNVNIGVT